MMTFSLSEEQVDRYNKWKEGVLKDVAPDELGVRDGFLFVPCTAGMGVKVICGQHQLDLTDYKNMPNK